MALPHCITCLLLFLLVILVVFLMYKRDHSVHLEISHKKISYQVQTWCALSVFYRQRDTARAEEHLGGSSQIVLILLYLPSLP